MLHLGAEVTGRTGLTARLAWAGGPLAAMTAVYTAYLFAQAKARDLWQNPLLPPHLLVQCLMAGAGVLSLLAPVWDGGSTGMLRVFFAASTSVHLLMTAGEITLPHVSEHARLAVFEMTRGRFSRWFWAGTILTVAGVFAPWAGGSVVVLGLVGLAAHEHAYVQAGQAVPLA